MTHQVPEPPVPAGTTTDVEPWYSPLRRRPGAEPRGTWRDGPGDLSWPDVVIGPRMTMWIPRVMLVVAVVLVTLTSDSLMDSRSYLVFLSLALVTAIWQEIWQRWHLRSLGVRVAICTVQWALSFAMVLTNPVAAFFGWSGFMIAATLFTGAFLIVFVTLTGAAVALGQVGGWPSVVEQPSVFVLLVVVNAGVALAFMIVISKREEAVRRRDAATRELLATQRLNVRLQQQLIDQARETGVASERARIAREIHDTVAQGLVGVITQLEAVDPGALPAATTSRLQVATTLARDALGEARRAVHALQPAALDAADLPDALSAVVSAWAAATRTPTELRVAGESRATDHDAALIRVAQEALANSDRHARATQVAVTLTYLEDEVLLDITDDGRGFDTSRPEPPGLGGGHGLPGMAERMALAGGRLEVESEPGGGTVVSAAVPG